MPVESALFEQYQRLFFTLRLHDVLTVLLQWYDPERLRALDSAGQQDIPPLMREAYRVLALCTRNFEPAKLALLPSVQVFLSHVGHEGLVDTEENEISPTHLLIEIFRDNTSISESTVHDVVAAMGMMMESSEALKTFSPRFIILLRTFVSAHGVLISRNQQYVCTALQEHREVLRLCSCDELQSLIKRYGTAAPWQGSTGAGVEATGEPTRVDIDEMLRSKSLPSAPLKKQLRYHCELLGLLGELCVGEEAHSARTELFVRQLFTLEVLLAHLQIRTLPFALRANYNFLFVHSYLQVATALPSLLMDPALPLLLDMLCDELYSGKEALAGQKIDATVETGLDHIDYKHNHNGVMVGRTTFLNYIFESVLPTIKAFLSWGMFPKARREEDYSGGKQSPQRRKSQRRSSTFSETTLHQMYLQDMDIERQLLDSKQRVKDLMNAMLTSASETLLSDDQQQALEECLGEVARLDRDNKGMDSPKNDKQSAAPTKALAASEATSGAVASLAPSMATNIKSGIWHRRSSAAAAQRSHAGPEEAELHDDTSSSNEHGGSNLGLLQYLKAYAEHFSEQFVHTASHSARRTWIEQRSLVAVHAELFFHWPASDLEKIHEIDKPDVPLKGNVLRRLFKGRGAKRAQDGRPNGELQPDEKSQLKMGDLSKLMRMLMRMRADGQTERRLEHIVNTVATLVEIKGHRNYPKSELVELQETLTNSSALELALALSASVHMPLSTTGLILLNCLLQAGNRQVQEIVIDMLSSKASSLEAFDGSGSSFAQTVAVRLTRAVERIPERRIHELCLRLQRAADTALQVGDVDGSRLESSAQPEPVLSTLQLLCEGHYDKAQEFLREQPGDPRTINLVVTAAEMLSALHRSFDDFDAELASQTRTCLEALMEMVQGNESRKNARELLDQDVCNTLSRIVCLPSEAEGEVRSRSSEQGGDQIRRRRGSRWRGGRMNDGAMQTMLLNTQLLMKVQLTALQCMNSILENCHHNESAMERVRRDAAPRELSQRINELVCLLTQNGEDGQATDVIQCIHRDADTSRVIEDVSYELYLFLLTLESESTSMVTPSVTEEINKSAQSHLQQFVASLELVTPEGELQKIFFRFPKWCLHLKTSLLRPNFHLHVDRDTPGRNVLDFVDQIDLFEIEMKHQDLVHSFWLWRFLKRERRWFGYRTTIRNAFNDLTLLIAIVQNIVLIVIDYLALYSFSDGSEAGGSGGEHRSLGTAKDKSLSVNPDDLENGDSHLLSRFFNRTFVHQSIPVLHKPYYPTESMELMSGLGYIQCVTCFVVLVMHLVGIGIVQLKAHSLSCAHDELSNAQQELETALCSNGDRVGALSVFNVVVAEASSDDIKRLKGRVEDAKQSVSDRGRRYLWRALLRMLFDPQVMWLSALFAFAVTGLYPLLLIDLITKSSELMKVLEAVTTNLRSLILTFLLTVIVLYQFAVMLSFGGGENQMLDSLASPAFCTTLLECSVSVITFGLRHGDLNQITAERLAVPATDVIGEPTYYDNMHGPGVIFVLIFYIIVGVILLNVVFGIIIDAFAALRQADAARKEHMQNTCFVRSCPVSMRGPLGPSPPLPLLAAC